jgi:hypothetical protein
MNRQYSQVGNAVPVHLGIAIGRTLLGATASDGSGLSHDHFEGALDQAIKRLRSAARNKRGHDDRQTSFCGFTQ